MRYPIVNLRRKSHHLLTVSVGVLARCGVHSRSHAICLMMGVFFTTGCQNQPSDATPNERPKKQAPVSDRQPKEQDTPEKNTDSPPDVSETISRDLKFVPDYALAVAVMRPTQMLEIPDVATFPGVDLQGGNPIKPSNVERCALVLLPDSGKYFDGRSGGNGLTLGFVVEMNVDAPQQKLVNQLSPGAERAKGKEDIYWPREVSYEQLSIAFPDKKTMVAAFGTVAMLEMLNLEKRPQQDSRLFKAYRQNDPQAQFAAAIDVDRLRHFYDLANTQLSDKSDFASNILLSLSHRTKTASLSWDISRPDGFSLQLDTDGDATVAKEQALQLLAATQTAVENTQQYLIDELGTGQQTEITEVTRSLSNMVEPLEPEINEATAIVNSHKFPVANETLQRIAKLAAYQVAVLRKRAMRFQTSYAFAILGLQMHNYNDVYAKLPQNIVSDDGKLLLSWRVNLLPYLGEFGGSEEVKLYKKFHLDEPWDSPHNKPLSEQMPKIFRTRDSTPDANVTHLQAVTGPGTVFGEGIEKFEQITDGLPNTLAFIETQEPVIWTKPEDFEFDHDQPHNGLRPGEALGVLFNGQRVELKPETDDEMIRHIALFDDGGQFDVESIWWKRSGSHTVEPKQRKARDPDLLLEVVQDGMRDEKRAALNRLTDYDLKLKRSDAKKVVDGLLPLVKTNDPNLRGWVLEVLAKWAKRGRLDWKKVEPLLDDPYEQNRWQVFEILGASGDPQVIPILLKGRPEDTRIRWNVIYERLGKVAIEGTLPLLKSADEELRFNACIVIANEGDKSHVPKLRPLLEDDAERVRNMAKRAIERLENPEE